MIDPQLNGSAALLAGNSAANRAQARRALSSRIVWPGIVFALLAMSLTVSGITIWAAVSDRSFGIEPDYYQRALAWDLSAAARRRSEALGWSHSILPITAPDPLGFGQVEVRLTDSEGRPIEGALLEADVFHRARSRDRAIVRFAEVEPGVYRGGMYMGRAGQWVVQLRATRAGDTMLANDEIWVERGEHAP